MLKIMENNNYKRQDHEPPLAIEKWGWRYHHLGVPTNKPIKGEIYLSSYKLYVCGFEKSPFGIEWMRYEADSPVNKLVQSVPHIAFEVDDLDFELSRFNFNVITEPNSPGNEVRVAMIEHDGAIIELIEFRNKKKE
jgi:hypothetical protein